MNRPTDYPLEPSGPDSTTDASTSDLTYAELRNRLIEKKNVTNEMINSARLKLETAHSESDTDANKAKSSEDRYKLKRIRDRFRPK